MLTDMLYLSYGKQLFSSIWYQRSLKLSTGPKAWRKIRETGRSPDELRRVEKHNKSLKNCICLVEKKEKTERNYFNSLSYAKTFSVIKVSSGKS